MILLFKNCKISMSLDTIFILRLNAVFSAFKSPIQTTGKSFSSSSAKLITSYMLMKTFGHTV